jgi:hypothetical protein
MATTYETRGVLAGAYRGRDDVGERRTHVVAIGNNGGGYIGERVLCRRVRPENICDAGAYTAEQLAAPATCAECARRDPRHSRATIAATGEPGCGGTCRVHRANRWSTEECRV